MSADVSNPVLGATETFKPLLYTVPEACRCLGVGRTTLYEAIAAGRLDARKLGAKTLVTAESIRRFAESLPRAPIGRNSS